MTFTTSLPKQQGWEMVVGVWEGRTIGLLEFFLCRRSSVRIPSETASLNLQEESM